ncbi:MAG: GlxA family transcriptional regulator [Massilia sp.]
MTKTVSLLVFPGVQSLDVSGPLDVFAEANRFLPPEQHYRLEVVGVERGLLACSNGLLIQAHRHFSELTGSVDLLLVAGGTVLLQQPFSAQLHEWLRAAAAQAGLFGSICNGALLLARAGLLDGRTVTTHWNDAALLSELCPTAQVEADRLFVHDGKLVTSAGVTAGIDLCLYLVARDHGPDLALDVARRLVVFTQRGGGQSQFSPFLTPYVEAGSPVAQVQQYVLRHLADDLSIAVLAEVANMSVRNFARTFARDAKATPADFVESARLDAARTMLENSNIPLKTVAWHCGLRDAHQLLKVFRRRLGVSPQQYRQHFGAAG